MGKDFILIKKILSLHSQFEKRNIFNNMANHQSAKKRVRQSAKRRLKNRYYKKSTRTAIKNLREMTDQAEAEKFLPKVSSMIDRLAKNNTIHKNKAANLKSKLTKHVKSLGANA